MDLEAPQMSSDDKSSNKKGNSDVLRKTVSTVPEESQKEERKKLRWQLGPCLGKGAFAEVYQGIDTESGKFMAVKQVTLKNESSNEARQKNVKNEKQSKSKLRSKKEKITIKIIMRIIMN